MDATFDRLDQIAIAVARADASGFGVLSTGGKVYVALAPTMRHCFPRWTTRLPKRLPAWAQSRRHENSINKLNACVACIHNCSIARHVVDNWYSLYLFIGVP